MTHAKKEKLGILRRWNYSSGDGYSQQAPWFTDMSTTNTQRMLSSWAGMNGTKPEPWPKPVIGPQHGQATLPVLLLPCHYGEFKQFKEI